jgi:hypothetical protein
MTVDIDKLKALALAATPGKRRWWAAKDGDHDYAQIAAGREHVAQVRIRSITEADLNLFVATDPATVLELIAEVEKLHARFEYIEEHATTHGGGNGFTVSFFVPVDCEDIGCGIDAAIEKEKV